MTSKQTKNSTLQSGQRPIGDPLTQPRQQTGLLTAEHTQPNEPVDHMEHFASQLKQEPPIDQEEETSDPDRASQAPAIETLTDQGVSAAQTLKGESLLYAQSASTSDASAGAADSGTSGAAGTSTIAGVVAMGFSILAVGIAANNSGSIASAAPGASGIVADGYIEGARIWIDTDGDGEKDLDTGVDTDENGAFELPPGTPSGTIIAIGGTNVDTGLPNLIVLRAPAGSTVVNPLTTLVQAYIDSSDSPVDLQEAVNAVAAALGISKEIDLLNYDPIANDNPAVQKVAAQIATILTVAAGVNEEVQQTILEGLVDVIQTAVSSSEGSVTSISLADPEVLADILSGAGLDSSITQTITQINDQIGNAATIDAISNTQKEALSNQVPTIVAQFLKITFTEEDGPHNALGVVINNDLTVSDLDGAIVSAAVTLTNTKAGDQLLFTPTGTIKGAITDVGGNAVLTLTAIAGQSPSTAEFEAALETVRFNNTLDNPDTTPRVIEFRVSDGVATSLAATQTVDVVPVVDLFSGTGGSDSITGTDGPDSIDGGAGIDTAVYTGAITAAMIAANGSGGWTVTSSAEGTDTLTSIEIIQGANPEGAATGRFLLVGNGGFLTIQAAIDAAVAGDTVLVAGGNYTEDVLITKAITLKGAGTETDILGTITIQSSNVAIEDLDVNPAGSGVGAGNGIIIGFNQNDLAVHSNISISRVTVTDASSGIWLDRCDVVNLSLTDVNLLNNYVGFDSTTNGRTPGAGVGISGLTITGGTIAGNEVWGIFTNNGASGTAIITGIVIDGTTFINNGANWSGPVDNVPNGGDLYLASYSDSSLILRDLTFTTETRGAIFVSGTGQDVDDFVFDNISVTTDADGTFRIIKLSGLTENEQTFAKLINGIAVSGGGTKVLAELSGGAGNDSIVGTSSADLINPSTGNDTLRGAGGDDYLQGGDGTDTAFYTTLLTASMFTAVADAYPWRDGNQAGWQVATGGAEGTDLITGIEILDDGDDTEIFLVGNGGFADITAAQTAAAAGGTSGVRAEGDTILVATGGSFVWGGMRWDEVVVNLA